MTHAKSIKRAKLPIQGWSLVPLAVAAVLVSSVTATAQDGVRAMERTVSVSATGKVAATPDQASISTGVRSEAKTAREAMTQNSAAMTKLIDGLKSLGIDAKDIQTTNVQLSQRYAQNRGQGEPQVNGYIAHNQVTIRVRDLKKLGDVLDQSITFGANQMGGISFEVSGEETLKDRARQEAMVNAKRRAALYAAAAGVGVGPVLAISETVAGPPRVFAGHARTAMADAVPVEAGSVDLSVQVHVTYGLVAKP